MDQQQIPQQENQYTKENFIQAVNFLFGNNTQSDIDKIQEYNTFLTGFEKSREAWVICSQTLMEINQHQEVVYFNAAKFLKTKLQYDFAQLSEVDAKQFSQQIVQVIKIFSTLKMERSLRTQFSLILIYLYFHTYDQWPDFIEFMKNTFYQNQECHPFLYSVYEEMPYEIENDSIVIDEEKRSKLFENLAQLQIRIIQEIAELQKNTQDTQIQYYGLKVFRNWLEFKYHPQLWDNLDQHPLTKLAFESTECPELQEKACDIIIAILDFIEEPQQHQKLFIIIKNYVFSYFDKCKQAIQEDMSDDIQIYLQIFTKFGKRALHEFLINTDQAAQDFITNYLVLSETEEIDNCETIASFWTKFFKIISELEAEQKQQALQKFENLIKRVVHITVKKCRYSPEQFNQYNFLKPSKVEKQKEEYEEKNRERVNMKEIQEEASLCIGVLAFSTIIIEDLLAQDYQLVEQINQNQDNYTTQQVQQACSNLEASLSSIHKAVSNEFDRVRDTMKDQIINIMQLILNTAQKFDYVKLQRTCLKYFQTFPNFLSEYPELQGKTFQLISNNFSNQFLKSIAFETFESVCSENQSFVRQNLGDFMVLLEKFPASDEILNGLATVVCEDDEYLQKYLINLCQPYAKKIQAILNNEIQLEQGQTNVESLITQFDKLTLIIKNVPQRDSGFPHDLIKAIFQDIWPYLQKIMQQFTNERLIERVIRLTKYIMRCLKDDFAVFLKDLFECVLSNFQRFPISTYMYAIEVTVTVFSHHQDYNQFLSENLAKMCQLSLNHFDSFNNTLAAFSEEPHMCEDFFGMLLRIMKYSPQVVLTMNIQDTLIDLVLKGMYISDIKAGQSMFSFMEHLYDLFISEQYKKASQEELQLYQNLKNSVINFGQHVMNRCFQVQVDYPPQALSGYISDIAFVQMKAFPELSVQWFAQAAENQFSVDILTLSEKEKIVGLIQNIANPEKERDLMEMLGLIIQRCKRSYMRQRNI